VLNPYARLPQNLRSTSNQGRTIIGQILRRNGIEANKYKL